MGVADGVLSYERACTAASLCCYRDPARVAEAPKDLVR
jgi:hypothetical protein